MGSIFLVTILMIAIPAIKDFKVFISKMISTLKLKCHSISLSLNFLSDNKIEEIKTISSFVHLKLKLNLRTNLKIKDLNKRKNSIKVKILFFHKKFFWHDRMKDNKINMKSKLFYFNVKIKNNLYKKNCKIHSKHPKATKIKMIKIR
jgi:hypothetical protein